MFICGDVNNFIFTYLHQIAQYYLSACSIRLTQCHELGVTRCRTAASERLKQGWFLCSCSSKRLVAWWRRDSPTGHMVSECVVSLSAYRQVGCLGSHTETQRAGCCSESLVSAYVSSHVKVHVRLHMVADCIALFTFSQWNWVIIV
jgi:hypothetical protein